MTRDELHYDAEIDFLQQEPRSDIEKLTVAIENFESIAQEYLNDDSITNKERVALNVVRSSFNKLEELNKLTGDKGMNFYDWCRTAGALLDSLIDLAVFEAFSTK